MELALPRTDDGTAIAFRPSWGQRVRPLAVAVTLFAGIATFVLVRPNEAVALAHDEPRHAKVRSDETQGTGRSGVQRHDGVRHPRPCPPALASAIPASAHRHSRQLYQPVLTDHVPLPQMAE